MSRGLISQPRSANICGLIPLEKPAIRDRLEGSIPLMRPSSCAFKDKPQLPLKVDRRYLLNKYTRPRIQVGRYAPS